MKDKDLWVRLALSFVVLAAGCLVIPDWRTFWGVMLLLWGAQIAQDVAEAKADRVAASRLDELNAELDHDLLGPCASQRETNIDSGSSSPSA